MTQQEICFARDFIYSLLQECTQSKDLAVARHAHFLIFSSGLDTVSVLRDHLIRAFTSCGCLREAHHVFDRIPKPSVYTWNAIMSAHTKLGDGNTAVRMYFRMRRRKIEPDRVTFLTTLKACRALNMSRYGMVIHDHIIRMGLELEKPLQNTLIDMYAKGENIPEARKMFDGMGTRRNEVTWQAMIVGYIHCGQIAPALELLELMHIHGVTPSTVIFLYVLKACAATGAIEHGRIIHKWIKSCGLDKDIIIGSALLDMYSKCGSLSEAYNVFNELPCRNVVTWGAMIAAYVKHGHSLAALEAFEKMEQESVQPDEALFSSILKACSDLGALELGMLIHDQIHRGSLHGDVVLGNILIDMYAKCGVLEESLKVFNGLQDRDVVSWGTMITVYVQHECPLAALDLFQMMQDKGLQVSNVIYVGILKACGTIGAAAQGRLIHDHLLRNCTDHVVIIDNALVDMYSKCGILKEAQRVLEMLTKPGIVSWGAIIAGYAQHGDSCMIKYCLESMLQQGLKPDAGILTSILAGSSHFGSLDEGHWFVKQEVDNAPLDDIYINCMIDFLGRAGCLKEADTLIHSLPFLPDIVGWRSLLTGCKTYGDTELGQRSFNQLA